MTIMYHGLGYMNKYDDLFKSQPSCEVKRGKKRRKKSLFDIMRGLFIVVSDVNCGFPHMKRKVAESAS